MAEMDKLESAPGRKEGDGSESGNGAQLVESLWSNRASTGTGDGDEASAGDMTLAGDLGLASGASLASDLASGSDMVVTSSAGGMPSAGDVTSADGMAFAGDAVPADDVASTGRGSKRPAHHTGVVGAEVALVTRDCTGDCEERGTAMGG